MTFLIVLLVFFFMVAMSVAYFRCEARPPFAKKKKSVEKPQEPELSYLEEFLNKIKDSLPRGKGFIYEVSTSTNCSGDLIVKVNVIDPVEDEQLTTMDFDSAYGFASVTYTMERSIMDVYKRQEIKRLAGQTEIIS